MCTGCDRQVERISVAYDRLIVINQVVAKALKLSETSQMAMIEQRLREFIDKQWELLRVQSSIRARNLTGEGKSAKQVAAAVDKIMGKWAGNVTPRFNRDTATIYKLARVAGWKKATGKTKAPLVFDTPNAAAMEEKVEKAKPTAAVLPSFDLADREAIAALADRNTFWIGSHYDDHVSGMVAQTTSETIAESGVGRRAAALLMAERVRDTLGVVAAPGGFTGTSIQYFEGLVANAMTVGRVFGQMRSFAAAGITRYQIMNPQDDRTCQVCGHLDGKTFEIDHGMDQMRSEMDARSPADIRSIHPWLSIGQVLAISSTAGPLSGARGTSDASALASAGFSLPPFHFRCRCTVDVDAASGSSFVE